MASPHPEGLTRPGSGWMIAFDVVVAMFITVVWLRLFEARGFATAAMLHVLAFVLRMLAWLVYHDRALRSIADLCERPDPTDQQLNAANDALHRFPQQHALVYALSWTGYFALGLAMSVLASALTVRDDELLAGGSLALGTSLAVFVPAMLGMQSEVEPLQLRVHAAQQQRGISTPSFPSTLTTRLANQSLSMVLGPVLIMAALAWHAELVTTRSTDFWSNLVLAMLGILAITGLGVVAQIRSLVAPVERMSATLARVVEVGDLRAIDDVPILRNDEIGSLGRDLNRLLDNQRRLTALAQATAQGRPTTDLDHPGELAQAVHTMAERVRSVLSLTRELTAKLNDTATALRSTAATQERVHGQQSSSVYSIGSNMTSLESSAAQIAAAVVEVSDNAESTLAANDELAQGIVLLDEHTRGIRDLLDIIREVASRSDLLALNGALEATRVGDQGAGFGLIADEMRRLAERVTGTVSDVRRLVTDIATVSEANVDVTELGRTLAEGTTNAAREIASATYRQTTETEQVANGVRELAAFIAQTAVATEQTRMIADELQVLAEVLVVQVRVVEEAGLEE